MKALFLFLAFFIVSSVSIIASEDQELTAYTRFLKNFEIQEIGEIRKIFFILDNDWVLTSEVSSFEEHKLYSLPRLLNTRVFIQTEPQMPGLEISLENPNKPGYDKISFHVGISKETYDSCLSIVDIQFIDHWYGMDVMIILSDHSSWWVPYRSNDSVKNYFNPGDRVAVSYRYDKENNDPGYPCSLVNLDISDRFHSTYRFNKGAREIYPIEDPRCISIGLIPES